MLSGYRLSDTKEDKGKMPVHKKNWPETLSAHDALTKGLAVPPPSQMKG